MTVKSPINYDTREQKFNYLRSAIAFRILMFVLGINLDSRMNEPIKRWKWTVLAVAENWQRSAKN